MMIFRVYIKQFLLFYLILIAINACYEPPTKPQFKETIILSGYLYVGQSVDSIFVRKSLPIGIPYSNTRAAVSGAIVTLKTNSQQFSLSEYPEYPGVYFVPAEEHVVSAGETYEINVQAGNHQVQASTIAPEQISINLLSDNQRSYLGSPFKIIWNQVEGAKGYLVTTIADPPYDNRVHIEGFLDSTDVIEDSLTAFSPVSNFSMGDRDLFLEIPWFMFWYYSDYTIKVYAADQNLYDLSSSQVMYAAQSSEYEQPNYNIRGGIGIFSAVSVDSVRVKVLRQPDLGRLQ
jgi:hypothetical protein